MRAARRATALGIALSLAHVILALLSPPCSAFAPSSSPLSLDLHTRRYGSRSSFGVSGRVSRRGSTRLRMGLDLVTYLRTEWVSAALCTNQTPRSADVCLQLGTEDGRAVTFIPKTVRELITSSAEADGMLTLGARRELKAQYDRRRAAIVTYVDQPADDLKETPDETVDVVVSLQAAERMRQNGLDWKRSVREAARVLKPGGRLLFVEQTDVAGESYLEYVKKLCTMSDDDGEENVSVEEGQDVLRLPIFDDVGFDQVDLVLVPHVAGVAIKALDAGMTPEERAEKERLEEEDRVAALSISAFEKGNKRRKRRKKKKAVESEGEESS